MLGFKKALERLEDVEGQVLFTIGQERKSVFNEYLDKRFNVRFADPNKFLIPLI